MKLFLFFDDWMIDATRDIVRRWPLAQASGIPPWTEANGYPYVCYDKFQEKYRCWYARYRGEEVKKDPSTAWLEPAILKGLFYAESDDVLSFQPCKHGGPTDDRFPDSPHSLKFPPRDGNPLKIEAFNTVYLDEQTDNPAERYKAAADAGFLYTSPDGIDWTPHLDRRWMEGLDSDTGNNLFYNPVTGRYQIICRTGGLDRRVAVTESTDLREFGPRRVILQPDPLDPPLFQFYGLKAFWYEDIFIGLLWDNFIPNVEPVVDQNLRGGVKMCGTVDGSLAYSYDGLYWLRGPRTPLLPRAEMPEFGWAGYYPTSLVVGPDDMIRIYSQAERLEHGEFKQQREFLAQGQGDGAMTVHTMRKDGFAYLEPVGAYGWVRTRGLVPRDGDLTVNYKAPLGQVRIQVCDKAGKPFAGFSFEDCVPLHGDELAARPAWKEKQLGELAGQWVRLEFELYQARLYAYRWDCQLHYALNPQERI